MYFSNTLYEIVSVSLRSKILSLSLSIISVSLLTYLLKKNPQSC